jgi:hypothetical protein
MDGGKVLICNLSKGKLGDETSSLLGALLATGFAQAAQARATVPEDQRRDFTLYIEQLSERLRATIMASTSIKFAGGVSARDASAFAKEMRCEPEFVQSTRKHAKATEFACWIKNTTPRAIRLEVPLGVVGGMPKLEQHAYDQLIAANRARYCARPGKRRGPNRARYRHRLSAGSREKANLNSVHRSCFKIRTA